MSMIIGLPGAGFTPIDPDSLTSEVMGSIRALTACMARWLDVFERYEGRMLDHDRGLA